MSTLSIRSLPQKVEEALARELKKSGKNKTQIVIAALEAFFHLKPQKDRRRKIRNFFGKMSTKEFSNFQKATQDFEKIDESLWK